MNAKYDAVLKHLDADKAVELSRQALRIESYSGQEEAVARFFVDAMREAGLEAELQPVPASATLGASRTSLSDNACATSS